MSILVSDWKDVQFAGPLAKKYGVGIEVLEYCDPKYLDADLDAEAFLALLPRGVKAMCLHGPFLDLVPASEDPEVSGVARRRFDSALVAARKLGIRRIVLHSGLMLKTYPPEIWLENSLVFWRDFLARVPEGTEIHMENIYEDDYQALGELVDCLASPKLSLCLDIGHVNANSSRPLSDWIKGLGRRIRHVHLHNNHGETDEHLRFGEGTIDMRAALELLREHSPDAVWTVETDLLEIEPSLEWLARNGYL